MERRSESFVSEMGYRETDKRRIVIENMRYLSPQKAAELYGVLSKINMDKRAVSSLSKTELTALYYGHIFTCSLGKSGFKTLNEDEMELYAEIMSDCLMRKFDDVEVYFYQYPRDLAPDEAKKFADKAERFRIIRDKFEKELGKKDRL